MPDGQQASTGALLRDLPHVQRADIAPDPLRDVDAACDTGQLR